MVWVVLPAPGPKGLFRPEPNELAMIWVLLAMPEPNGLLAVWGTLGAPGPGLVEVSEAESSPEEEEKLVSSAILKDTMRNNVI